MRFARFVFLESNTRLAVITTYDGDFEKYIMDFVDHIGDIFDMLLKFMADAPPLPVREHRQEFLDYVRSHDLRCIEPLQRLPAVDRAGRPPGHGSLSVSTPL